MESKLKCGCTIQDDERYYSDSWFGNSLFHSCIVVPHYDLVVFRRCAYNLGDTGTKDVSLILEKIYAI